jgi:Tfp pilus assembly protein PilO
MSPTQTRAVLIRQAACAVQALDADLNHLLDAYDFYVQRFPDDKELADLNVSIDALGSLPLIVAHQLTHWAQNEKSELSRDAFEIGVLNEFSLHMFALTNFMERKNVDVQDVVPEKVADAFNALKLTNTIL